MRRVALLLVMAPLGAASPQQGITVQVPSNPLTRTPLPPRPPANQPTSGLQPAPLPNRDIEDLPLAPSGNQPSLSPSLFNRTDTYRGDGFSKGSTATTEQERRVKPGVGFNLRMPFAPN